MNHFIANNVQGREKRTHFGQERTLVITVSTLGLSDTQLNQKVVKVVTKRKGLTLLIFHRNICETYPTGSGYAGVVT